MAALLEGLNEIITTVFVTTPLETFRILPNSIVVISGLFALITLSFPYTVLFGSLMESIGIFYALQSIALNLNVYDVFGGKRSFSQVCNTGLNAVSMNDFAERSQGGGIAFPSYAVYILSFIMSYIVSMYNTYSDELNALGDTRYFYGTMFLAAVLVITCTMRMLYSCDGLGITFFSILFGGALGFLLTRQNIALFGKGSLNLLGIPLLRGKAMNGQALYICPTQNPS